MNLLFFYMVCEIAAIVLGITLGVDMAVDTNGNMTTTILAIGVAAGLIIGFGLAFLTKRLLGRFNYPGLPFWIASIISGWTVGGLLFDAIAAQRHEWRITALVVLIGTLPGILLGFAMSWMYQWAGKPREVVVAGGGAAPIMIPVPVPVSDFGDFADGGTDRPIEEMTGYNLPARPDATSLERKLYEQTELVRSKYGSSLSQVLTEDSETYTARLVLPGQTDQLVVYVICTEAYANGKPPETILVEKTNFDGSNSRQLPYHAGIVDRWNSSYTLLDIVNDVVDNLNKMNIR